MMWLENNSNKLFRALRQTFAPKNSFSEVGRRHRAQMYRDILYDLRLAPNFYGIDPWVQNFFLAEQK